MRTLALLPTCLCLMARPSTQSEIRGRVLDSLGRPLSGAAVALVQLGESQVPTLRAHTDAQGAYRLKAARGAYALTVTHPDHLAAYRPKVEVVAPWVNLGPVTLAEGGQVLEGRLEATKGVATEKVRLAFARISQEEGDVFLADLHGGAFKLRLPEGTYLPLGEGAALKTPRPIPLNATTAPLRLTLEPAPSPAPPAVRAWIQTHGIPLAGVEAGRGFEDMAPLAQVVGDARVVSLGEATHGTREFFQLKHRMLEYLVREKGFTAFAIEANLPECEALNAYVLTGQGDPRKGLDGIYFWTWNTEEVLALVEWMRAWNAEPGHVRKLRFYGFDNQMAPLAYAKVKAGLDADDPQLAAWMARELGELGQPAGPQQPEPGRVKALVEAAAELGRRLDAKPGFDPFLRRCARVLEQKLAIDLVPAAGSAARDRGMAENVQWILQQEGPQGRVVLWAHNGHVQAGQDLGDQPWMGGHLRQALGRDMVVFGFAFREGSFQAVDFGPARGGLRDFTVKPQGAATLDAALASAGAPVLALDLRRVPPSGTVRAWFATAQGTFGTGAGFREGGEASAVVPTHALEAYDALLFVARTTAARPNHPRQAPKPAATAS